ncbi:MAG: ABC transporter ATP-binding protein [Proteobacteria bacterium]|nr:ABC transporter ATP-binding protein [Pseudomonadota bacterium]
MAQAVVLQANFGKRSRVNEPVVSFVNVNKTYDGKALVVDDLNLSVQRGEFLTLLGSSGSGKTSSLMMVAGFETPTSGDILLDGKSITRLPAYRRNIGVVFQNYALFPHMTVAENLAFPLQARKVAKGDIARKVSRVLEIVRLTGYEDRKAPQLSGGQQQRVALARALIFDPALVLMDEPLGALDRQLREAMQYEIKRIHDSLGISVIYVTHDQDEALAMSNRIVVLEKGKIEQVGTPKELYEAPATAFVAGFVGENNCLKGRIGRVDGGRCAIEMPWGEVRAVAVGAGSAGADAAWSVRPERIELDPGHDGLDNVYDGVVRDFIYLGDQIRVCVAIDQNCTFVLKMTNNTSLAALAIGQSVKIGWRAVDCRAFGAHH